MKTLRHRIASPRLTLAGFVLLGLAVWATSSRPDVSSSWIALPAALLAMNLLASMTLHRSLRRGGLGLFHACLLVGMLAAAWGRLQHFEGRVELTQGATFDAQAVEALSRGPWNDGGVARLQFEQGPWQVHYVPGLRRAHTVSEVHVAGTAAAQRVGDTEPLVIDGYRFYTTHNKGFAPLLRWQGVDREAVTGAVHLPSYPLFDTKQEQQWRTPDGVLVKLWLRLDAPPSGRDGWVLEPAALDATLVVELQGRRIELRPGQQAFSPLGTLRYERLLGWMGYRIHHDPALAPLFWLALLGVAGLAWHLVTSGTMRRRLRMVFVPLAGRTQ